MAEKPKDEQETQETPAGYEIPVPTRDEVEDALRKIVEPPPSVRKRRRRSGH
jgi:hypothetical protein